MKIAMFIPLSGVLGIWGPSCVTCARLAAADINTTTGALGQAIELVFLDSGRSRELVAEDLRRELSAQEPIRAIVGMHLSSIRRFVASLLPPDMAYVFTPIYEDGERLENVFAIGETPDRLLSPGIDWLMERHRAERWLLVGNDYVWPKAIHRRADRLIRDRGGRVMGSRLIRFQTTNYDPIFEQIKEARPHAILMSLVGDEAVRFNRAFSESGLGRRVLRLSMAVEENVLYGIGEENTENLTLGASYIGNIRSRENDFFRERYHTLFGETPPMQNEFGQSCFEGLHYLVAMINAAYSTSARLMRMARLPRFESARYSGTGDDRARKVHVAVAEGLDLRVVDSR